MFTMKCPWCKTGEGDLIIAAQINEEESLNSYVCNSCKIAWSTKVEIKNSFEEDADREMMGDEAVDFGLGSIGNK